MNIYIWGTGRALGEVLDFYLPLDSVTAFVDNSVGRREYMGKKVLRPEELALRDYDAVLVACGAAREIQDQCLRIGIDLEKVIFLFNSLVPQDLNRNYALVELIFGENYAKTLKNRYHLVRSPDVDVLSLPEMDELTFDIFHRDFVRSKTFLLAVNEIKSRGVEGGIAEFGVFRGEFAELLNACFPDRKLYLFDTFHGFEDGEAAYELTQRNCNSAFVQAFKETSIKLVVSRMPYPDQLVIRPGFFPDSANNLDENFALVSLDVDFEASTLAGLEYFYPRLVKGGYLFIHDYNSRLAGVKRAVRRYEENSGNFLNKVPICDSNGTLVVVK